MSLPLNHALDLSKLIAQQLFQQYPSASGDLVRVAAKLKAIAAERVSNVIRFPTI